MTHTYTETNFLWRSHRHNWFYWKQVSLMKFSVNFNESLQLHKYTLFSFEIFWDLLFSTLNVKAQCTHKSEGVSNIALYNTYRLGRGGQQGFSCLMNTALWRVLRPIVKHHCLPACCHGNTLILAAGLKCCSQSWRMPCQNMWEKKQNLILPWLCRVNKNPIWQIFHKCSLCS